jgi:hypothetical protein
MVDKFKKHVARFPSRFLFFHVRFLSIILFMFSPFCSSEKSIIKTLQSQQKEDRRRAERNESILRQLERIDYQASTLAAKTDWCRKTKVKNESV